MQKDPFPNGMGPLLCLCFAAAGKNLVRCTGGSRTISEAAGNFTGGQLLAGFGVTALLIAGIGMAAAGTVILFLTVDKSDLKREGMLA